MVGFMKVAKMDIGGFSYVAQFAVCCKEERDKVNLDLAVSGVI
ncbi:MULTISPECIES: DNA polymerase III subunit theta [unclassified Pantoea]|nr:MULTISPECIES: DNA polymerase III subunit theta [unclassified Pantoea]